MAGPESEASRRAPLGALGLIHVGPGYVVIEKPTGLRSVPGKGPLGNLCAAVVVERAFPEASGPLTVHRLDMETSGLMVFALNPWAQRQLSAQFERREVSKRYVAVLDGCVAGDSGEVRIPIRLDVDNRPRQIVDFVQGREAVTRWRVLERLETSGGWRTRVEFEPLTGRSHQLRVHAAAGVDVGGLGCPIVGDTLYGRRDRRMMLHAISLGFAEPTGVWEVSSGVAVEFSSAAPF